ncbi:hypothetical protein TBK1r_25840 [Stieleria magnilauensis]|uniref:Transposase DDE domain-containing protein n=1 Tax=Stieleria magnilauensis TaxID=2527963 RepID=A0ABX5XPR3_9BACT|nr:hypothetical protein TBK1r_25840 [Planctomycetes bacterium TBK1r]
MTCGIPHEDDRETGGDEDGTPFFEKEILDRRCGKLTAYPTEQGRPQRPCPKKSTFHCRVTRARSHGEPDEVVV